MLMSHARALAEARSCLAALADRSNVFDASLAYNRVLLQLDTLYGDQTPATHDVTIIDRDPLYAAAEKAVEALVSHGADALRIELLLAALENARALDEP